MSDDELFNVWQFFKDGYSEKVRENVSAKEAVNAFAHYTQSVGAQAGFVTRVIITDSGDFTNAEWVAGLGYRAGSSKPYQQWQRR